MEEARQRTQTRIRLRGGTVLPQSERDLPGQPKKVGRYEILSEIGKGAMGMVYKARDPLLDRVVALKTLLAPGYLGKEVRRSFIERFEREAKAAGRMAHPYIVTIFDVGLDAENPYLVMEYVPGETLAARLDRGRMPLSDAVSCASNLAGALGFAHAQRIVHRDVKPANVLDAGTSGWKLADFGIARLPDSDLTQVGIFVGTPGYAPPEVVRGGRYTPAGDVFAWGAVTYELLCGQIPYGGEDPSNVNQRVLAGPPTPPEQYEPQLPRALSAVVMRAMATDAAQRYATCVEAQQGLSEAWAQLGGGSGAGVVVPVTAPERSGRPSSRDFPSELPTEISGPPSMRAPATDKEPDAAAAAAARAAHATSVLPDRDESLRRAVQAPEPVAERKRPLVEGGARGGAEKGTVPGTPPARRRLEAPRARSSMAPWIILIVVVMMLVGGVGAYVAWKMGQKQGQKQGQKAPPPGQPAPPPQ